jgi:hypothetical protein
VGIGKLRLISALFAATTLPAIAQSQVIGMTETGSACEIAFAYEGYEPETLLLDEACADITAQMVDESTLRQIGQWDELDGFDRDFIAAMPQGRVLYVAGSFTAAIYPIGTTGLTYEVTLSD